MYRVGDVANYFIDRSLAEGIPLTPMKLQKLLYFAHGWYLAFKQRPLIDRPFEVWRWGPVERELYHEMADYGDQPIRRKSALVSGDPGEPVLDAEAIELLNSIWKSYGHMSASDLSARTHEAGSPWERAVLQFGGLPNVPRATTLSDEEIGRFFRTKYDRTRSAA